jgi:hypothetical protein
VGVLVGAGVVGIALGEGVGETANATLVGGSVTVAAVVLDTASVGNTVFDSAGEGAVDEQAVTTIKRTSAIESVSVVSLDIHPPDGVQ